LIHVGDRRNPGFPQPFQQFTTMDREQKENRSCEGYPVSTKDNSYSA